MKAMLLSLMIFLSACVSMEPQKLDPAVYYKNDICFSFRVPKKKQYVGGVLKYFRIRIGSSSKLVKFCGTGVLPYMSSYHLEVRSKGKLNFFTMTTCHKEDTTENPDRGIFKKDGKINIIYKPNAVERGEACPMHIAAYDRRSRHAFGVLAFDHPKYRLPATLECNGYKTLSNGTSICQSRQGLLQRLVFKDEVKAYDPVNGAADRKGPCPKLATEDNKTFLFKIPNRECVYGFVDRKTKKEHLHYSVGYEEIIVRE